jgi:hypothetical protein
VQPLTARHHNKLGQLKAVFLAPILSLGEVLEDVLADAELDGMRADARLEGKEARADVRVASDGRQLAGGAVETAVESLHQGELGGGRGGGGKAGGRRSRHPGQEVGKDITLGGRLLVKPGQLQREGLEDSSVGRRAMLLGCLGVEPPGDGVEVEGRWLRRKARAVDRSGRAEVGVAIGMGQVSVSGAKAGADGWGGGGGGGRSPGERCPIERR